jgi:hypothetical protein
MQELRRQQTASPMKKTARLMNRAVKEKRTLVGGLSEGGGAAALSTRDAVDWFVPRPDLARRCRCPTDLHNNQPREIVKSAPKKEGPGGGCAPGPSSPDPFLGGFESRPPLLCNRRPQGIVIKL